MTNKEQSDSKADHSELVEAKRHGLIGWLLGLRDYLCPDHEQDPDKRNKYPRAGSKLTEVISALQNTSKPTGEGWISIDDALPEKGSSYLFYIADQNHFEISEYPFSPFAPISHLNVSHWMPLPSPASQSEQPLSELPESEDSIVVFGGEIQSEQERYFSSCPSCGVINDLAPCKHCGYNGPMQEKKIHRASEQENEA